MRVDEIQPAKFKGFEDRTFKRKLRFNLVVGTNGT
jgi:AAA15 family ATPase/GTPase